MAEVRRQASLGDYLVREGIINQSQFNQALAVQNETMRSLGRVLVELGLITENLRMTILRKHFGFEVIGLKDTRVPTDILRAIPYSFAEKHRVVPFAVEKSDTLAVAMEDPSDLLVIDAIKSQISLNIRPYVASADDVQHVLNQYQTGDESQPILTAPRRVQHGAGYRFVEMFGFPVLALLPLLMFFAAIFWNWGGLADWMNTQSQAGNLGTWDLIFYIALSWGLWTLILFEVNGVLFKTEEDLEEI